MCASCVCVYADVECTDTLLPVTYPKFAGMMEAGDTLYVGRYLVSGADSASLYLEVWGWGDVVKFWAVLFRTAKPWGCCCCDSMAVARLLRYCVA